MVRIPLFLLSILLCVASADEDNPDGAGCIAYMTENATATLQCANLGFDGRSFSEVIGNWTVFGPGGLDMDEPMGLRKRNETPSDFLKKVRRLHISSLDRKVDFGESPFELLPNLRSFELWKSHERNWTPEVTIPADAFRHTPQLKKVNMGRLVLPESTIHALASLNDQLTELEISGLKPDERILMVLANFTKLRQLRVQAMCGDRDFPTAILEKSAPTLELIQVQKCSLPKITKNLFSSMPNLERLLWESSNITEIEPESFDANPKMAVVMMWCNKIRTLPDGLFSNLMNLTIIDFRGNELTGLSRSNFSHVETYNTTFSYYRDIVWN